MIKYDLNDRVAVVTAGAQGIGLVITETFNESMFELISVIIAKVVVFIF